jgi:arsenate reductase
MKKVQIYHNPRCSKSRAALEILVENKIKPEIIDYLKTPPDAGALRELLRKLQMRPRELMRNGESIYRDLRLDDPKLSDAALIEAMAENPILIERPIVVAGAKAVLGRPPENVLKLL